LRHDLVSRQAVAGSRVVSGFVISRTQARGIVPARGAAPEKTPAEAGASRVMQV
jgi:hypothetical protein